MEIELGDCIGIDRCTMPQEMFTEYQRHRLSNIELLHRLLIVLTFDGKWVSLNFRGESIGFQIS